MLGELDGGLTAELYHSTPGLLDLQNAVHIFGGQRVKVQTVGGIEVGGYGLGVVVDDDSLVAVLLQRPDTVYRAVVELDALSDPDGAGTEYQYLLLVVRVALQEDLRLVFLVKGGVEVRGLGLEFRSAGIYHLVGSLAVVRSAAHAGNALDGLIQEAGVLGLEIELLVQAALLQLMFDAGQVPQLAQEPLVDLGSGIDGIKINAAVECLKYGEDTLIVLYMQQFPDLIVGLVGILGQTQGVETQLDGADCLHNGLLKAGTDGHYLTGGLHLGAQGTLAIYELIKGPLGELADDIVQSRLKAGQGVTGDRVADLIQPVADGNLGGYLGNGITGGLGSQSRRTGYTGVYLNDGISWKLSGFRAN